MIVINACINQSSGIGSVQTEKFRKKIKTMHVEKYVVVNTVPKFLEALETYKNQRILLFTNFSPNYFYKKNGIDVNLFNEKPMPGWSVKEYSFSAALYYRICQEYSLETIHFITAAYINMIPDLLFLSITGTIPTTIKRKQDWEKNGSAYKLFLRFYMEDRIREPINRSHMY